MGVLAVFFHSRGSHLESIDSAGFVKITRNDPVVGKNKEELKAKMDYWEHCII
jgi:hypothetical protein